MKIIAYRSAQRQFELDRMMAELVGVGGLLNNVRVYLGPDRESGGRWLLFDHGPEHDVGGPLPGFRYERVEIIRSDEYGEEVMPGDMLTPRFGTAESDFGSIYLIDGVGYIADENAGDYFYEDQTETEEDAPLAPPAHAVEGIYSEPFGGHTVVCTCTQPDDTGAGAVQFYDMSLRDAVNAWAEHAIEASAS